MVSIEAIFYLLKGDYVQGVPLRMIQGISRIAKARETVGVVSVAWVLPPHINSP